MKPFGLTKTNCSPAKSSPHYQVAVEIVEMGRDNNQILITPFCLKETEVDYQIDQLIAGLERVRKDAKKIIRKNSK